MKIDKFGQTERLWMSFSEIDDIFIEEAELIGSGSRQVSRKRVVQYGAVFAIAYLLLRRRRTVRKKASNIAA